MRCLRVGGCALGVAFAVGGTEIVAAPASPQPSAPSPAASATIASGGPADAGPLDAATPSPAAGAPSTSAAAQSGQPPPAGSPQPGAVEPAPPPYGYPPYGYPPGYGPPPQGYPVGYLPAEDPPPETLPYQQGAPIPPGYRQDETMIVGLLVAGAVTAGSLWIFSGFIGTVITQVNRGIAHSSEREASNALYFLWIPLAGPFVTIGTGETAGPVTGLLVVDGVLQCAGLAAAIAGAVVRTDVLVWEGGQAQLVVGPAGRALGSVSVGLAGAF